MLERRLAQLLLVLIFILLNLGGVVHNTESSLACPDWPLCYGQVFPKMEGGILIEHSHRLLASLVGFITIILATTIQKKRVSDPITKRLGWTALVMVILQGVLGGLTVIYKLPTIVSTTHLGLSMIYFCTIILIHHRLGDLPKISETTKNNWNPKIKEIFFISLFGVYTQMILGAFMRHSGAGTSCGIGWENSLMCLDLETWQRTLLPALPQAKLHFTHRLYACIVAIIAIFAVFKSNTFLKSSGLDSSTQRKIKTISYLSLLFLGIQILLGVLTVATGLGVIPTTLHLGFASLLLATLWKCYLYYSQLEKQIFPKGTHTKLSDFLDLTKPKLTALVVLTAFIGLLIAPGKIDFFKGIWAIFLITVLVAGAAALNCYLEIEVDKKMVRTKDRPLPSGRMSAQAAFIFGVTLSLISTILLLLTVNWLTGILGATAFVLYLFAYTPLKQKSYIALFVGAVPGALPPLLGWTAVTGELNPMALCLFAILFFWQIPHFLAIAIYHSEDYARAEIQTLVYDKGFFVAKINIVIYTVILMALGILPFYLLNLAESYRNFAAIFGLAFLILALVGLTKKVTDEKFKSWAHTYFYASLIYLPGLLTAMIFLRG